jgi:hypothetical protein
MSGVARDDIKDRRRLVDYLLEAIAPLESYGIGPVPGVREKEDR